MKKRTEKRPRVYPASKMNVVILDVAMIEEHQKRWNETEYNWIIGFLDLLEVNFNCTQRSTWKWNVYQTYR